ncbi:hypothetical protein AB4090_13085 [Acidithiobacillus sp. IBUN Pt1247-S3]|uniref:hypothetical protein n=1 Tax=Acidithiobacillus sp. IBUN Pt1247-S3 TaxID=3166642 RepID=UPI0034E3C428
MRIITHRILLLLGCIASLAATHAALGQDMPAWTLPEGAVATPVAEHMELNGIALDVQTVRAALPARELETAMQKSCTSAGADFHAMDSGSEGLWQCRREGWSQVLRWQGRGSTTTGILSTMPLDQKPAAVAPAPLPLPDGTQPVSDLVSSDGGLRGRVLQVVSPLNTDQLRQWFLDAAKSRDWKLAQALSRRPGAMSLRKKGQSIDIAFMPGAPSQVKIVMVWQNR